MIGFDALAGFVADKLPKSSNPLSDVYLCALLDGHPAALRREINDMIGSDFFIHDKVSSD
jgi:hypothetical protein